MYIEELIDEIGRSSNNQFEVDDDRRCSLKLENTYTLTIEESSDGKIIYLYTVLGKVEAQSKNTVFNALMEANLFGLQTEGANFAFEPQEQVIVLYQHFYTQKTDYVEFEVLFWKFFKTTKVWTEKISDLVKTNHNNTHISVQQKQQWLKP